MRPSSHWGRRVSPAPVTVTVQDGGDEAAAPLLPPGRQEPPPELASSSSGAPPSSSPPAPSDPTASHPSSASPVSFFSWLSPSRWAAQQRQQQQQQQQQLQPSGYMALVPLSDARLKPRRTKLLLALALLLAAAVGASTFYLVPRGVSVGTIQVTTSSLSFNTSASTYAIVFQAAVPVFNPNFVPAVVAGSLEVRFYDAVAGRVELEPADVPPRSAPHVLTASLDASNVPRAFLATIYLQCFSYPRQLIFFLTGSFNASLFSGRATWRLPSIDNYFIVDCKSSSEGEDGAVRVSSPRESPMSSGSSLTSSSAGAAAPSAPL